jgi:hypothetical protein
MSACRRRPDIAKGFREDAHKQGLTQKQFDWVMGQYYSQMGGMVEHSAKVGTQRLQSELVKHYKTPEATTEAVRSAMSVVQAYGDEEEVAAAMGPQGNAPPWVLRVLAKVARDMGEDKGIEQGGILNAESLEELMKGGPGQPDSPYWNSNHPQHKSVLAKVERHHNAVAAQRQRKAA